MYFLGFVFVYLLLLNTTLAETYVGLEKFNAEFQCGKTEDTLKVCIDVSPNNNGVGLGTCGFNVYKELQIISKTQTRIIFTSVNTERRHTRENIGRPTISFLYILTDLWKNPVDEGKKFSFQILEIGQSDLKNIKT